MKKILIIGMIILTLMGCQTPTLKVGITKEKALLKLKGEPDYKTKILDYELWCCSAVKRGLFNFYYTDLYLLKNDIIIYHGWCRDEVDKAKHLAADWINNTSQTDLRRDIDNILNKQVRIGMRKMPVILSWGYPSDVKKTITRYGTSEIWMYRRGQFSYQSVHFDDGKVSIIGSD